MSKFSGGVLAGMFIFGLSWPGFGLLMVCVVIVSFVGKTIGENSLALTIYIVCAMALSYVLPFLAIIVTKSFKWLWIIPIATTVALALPSSFVSHYGCEAGEERAIYAMKAIPLMLGVFTVVKMTGSDETFDCKMWAGPRKG